MPMYIHTREENAYHSTETESEWSYQSMLPTLNVDVFTG